MSGIPVDIRSLADYERHAASQMPEASWQHLQDGSGQGLTVGVDRAAYDRIQLLPRRLTDLRGGSTAIQLFGEHHATPIFLAPLAYQKLAHEEGELATVRAATALGITTILSTLSSVTLEEVAAAATGAARELERPAVPLWFQLYFQEDRARTLPLVRRAEAAGYSAIVFTVDAAVKRAGFQLPPGVEAANLRGMPPQRQATASGAILFGTSLTEEAPRWEDLAWLRAETKLPLLVKGLVAPEDGRMAVDHGADGIILSNHGGRVLDGMPAAIDVLPLMREAVGAEVPLLVDGGVRAGTDVVKALALGARAVLVGRPQMHALAVGGFAGVAHMLHMLRAELELAMAQIGCRDVSMIDRRYLFDARAM
ncbi:MAG TPA: alpha-hydroxy acid oxidase [Sphingobium sp.]|uniref:alpha-hydroxy acid oxidase n=1 Tax=Sphingobium sp. TaxID=1912891 RepID=UPI002ED4A6B9